MVELTALSLGFKKCRKIWYLFCR